jgi:hypothetical protein
MTNPFQKLLGISGWKTLAGGLALMGLGAFMISQGQLESGAAKIAEGIALIGIGHKIEKGAAQ